MFISPQDVLVILEHYKYWLIFPIAVFEGPMISIISGFFVYLGYFNGYAIYPLLILADLVGDTLYYLIGRYGGRSLLLKKFGSYLGYDEESEKYIEEHFKKHSGKTLLLAKFTHGLGGTVQASAGIARMNYLDFLKWNFIGQIPKSLILLTIGFYLGRSYLTIDNYLNLIALITIGIVLLIILYLIINKRLKKSLIDDK